VPYIRDTEPLWDQRRIMTTYRMIESPWEPLNDDGLPKAL
jgi:hypothetical protein